MLPEMAFDLPIEVAGKERDQPTRADPEEDMRKFLAISMLVLAACSDAPAMTEPVAANSVPSGAMTATTVINGVTYEYGCPDFPCPITQIVVDHIENHLWFWMPPGTFAKPTIYLYILKTPVQLRQVAPTTVIEPPVIQPPPPPPTLTGPTIVVGKVFGPLSQITCDHFSLSLVSPDGGPWDFVTGQVTYEYGSVDSYTAVFTPNGNSSVVGFNWAAWNQLLAGTYTLYPPFPNTEYRAHFKANLERGTNTATVEHTFVCRKAPPPAPPAPTLSGPTGILGQRASKTSPFVCSNVLFTLVSPDGGPWTFVSGLRKIEFYMFDMIQNKWVLNGNSQTASVTSTGWQQLLAGTYAINPGVPSGPYKATFTITLARSPFQHTLTHSVDCGGPDFFDL